MMIDTMKNEKIEAGDLIKRDYLINNQLSIIFILKVLRCYRKNSSRYKGLVLSVRTPLTGTGCVDKVGEVKDILVFHGPSTVKTRKLT